MDTKTVFQFYTELHRMNILLSIPPLSLTQLPSWSHKRERGIFQRNTFLMTELQINCYWFRRQITHHQLQSVIHQYLKK
jgi:hypothetical protein